MQSDPIDKQAHDIKAHIYMNYNLEIEQLFKSPN